MRSFLTRATCHFLGHEDKLYPHVLFPVVACVHCHELAPAIFQPKNAVADMLDDLSERIGGLAENIFERVSRAVDDFCRAMRSEQWSDD